MQQLIRSRRSFGTTARLADDADERCVPARTHEVPVELRLRVAGDRRKSNAFLDLEGELACRGRVDPAAEDDERTNERSPGRAPHGRYAAGARGPLMRARPTRPNRALG